MDNVYDMQSVESEYFGYSEYFEEDEETEKEFWKYWLDERNYQKETNTGVFRECRTDSQ